MQDAITTLINTSDAQGKYLDDSSLDTLQEYFRSGDLRAKAAMTISANASTIVTKTVAKSLLYTDITGPGGNMYTCRRYAACIRDMDFFLRYGTYAMLAGDASILDERVLNGLKETYNSLGVPVGATIRAVQAMKEVVNDMLGAEAGKEVGYYFDHICSGLS
ncbi:allophycocyanin, beta subunit [Synechococcus sp. PCC 7335]|uniref:Allophycocyanin, beta subunit n=1 Tax=Synechococcus sp. (strain ATCC 29403 / PCC 7335) TaxID=91464 RepID=A0ACD6B9L1_SYNS7|nr:allophycocyanin subunit beta [Synechococcus sp. PCC 7335]EDX84695.1 allophycocyanin, beta subunit [Synechococcus sp. PCC 7335]